jgi:hypothetical protein
MQDYRKVAKDKIEEVEEDTRRHGDPALLFEEYQVPLTLAVLDKLDRIIELLEIQTPQHILHGKPSSSLPIPRTHPHSQPALDTPHA